MEAAKINHDQFTGIWRKLKSQLTAPREWAIDGSLEDDAADAAWEELSRFTYETVSLAAREYLESGQTKFPTWGQIVALIRAKMQIEQVYPKQETRPAASFISNRAPRALIETPEWQELCRTMQVDPVLAFDDWKGALRKRGRFKDPTRTPAA